MAGGRCFQRDSQIRERKSEGRQMPQTTKKKNEIGMGKPRRRSKEGVEEEERIPDGGEESSR